MKRAFVIVLFVFTYIGAFAQKFDSRTDSAWIAQLLQKQSCLIPQKSDAEGKWSTGKVIYSPDSCLRIGQVFSGLTEADAGVVGYFDVTVQYLYQNRIIEQNLSSENEAYNFQNYPIREVYKLPSGNRPVYLIIANQRLEKEPSKEKWLADFFSKPKDLAKEDLKVLKALTNVASVVALGTDSLEEIPFTDNSDYDYQYPPKLEEFKVGNSIELASVIKSTGSIAPIPYLKFYPKDNELRFLNVYDDGDGSDTASTRPYSNVYEGMLEYVDSGFVVQTDSSYFYPALASFKKTISSETYKIGPVTVKASAVETYEEIGAGVLQVLTFNYEIGNKTISAVNHLPDEVDLKPEYRLQKDSSLVIMVTNLTVPNRAGECGMCSYEDSDFWLVKKGSVKKLFSFSSNSGSSKITYEYGAGKLKREGKFYLKSPKEDEWEATLDKAYWKNNSTYVFRIANEHSYRNFYIHFDSQNSSSRIEVGPLLKIKASL